MLVAHDPVYVRRARYLASQARDAVPHYEHREVGYNFRLSNLLAGLGRGQLGGLETLVARRRAINARYRQVFGEVEGIGFMANAPYGTPTNWLTVITIDEQRFGASPAEVREHLERLDIESRPAWKPLHLQPVFAGSPTRGGAVAESIFRAGLCLPSGTTMQDADIERVAAAVLDSRSC
jgi:dTDP-4-amino-4,6-dideoxygalactose transaminase